MHKVPLDLQHAGKEHGFATGSALIPVFMFKHEAFSPYIGGRNTSFRPAG